MKLRKKCCPSVTLFRCHLHHVCNDSLSICLCCKEVTMHESHGSFQIFEGHVRAIPCPCLVRSGLLCCRLALALLITSSFDSFISRSNLPGVLSVFPPTTCQILPHSLPRLPPRYSLMLPLPQDDFLVPFATASFVTCIPSLALESPDPNQATPEEIKSRSSARVCASSFRYSGFLSSLYDSGAAASGTGCKRERSADVCRYFCKVATPLEDIEQVHSESTGGAALHQVRVCLWVRYFW